MAMSVVQRFVTFRRDFFFSVLVPRCVHSLSTDQQGYVRLRGVKANETQDRQLHLTAKRPIAYSLGACIMPQFAHDGGKEETSDLSMETDSWEDISPVSSRSKSLSEIQQSGIEDNDYKESAQGMLVVDRVAVSSATDKMSAYFSTLGVSKTPEKSLHYVIGLEFTSFATKVRLLCEGGLNELEACTLALNFPLTQLPGEFVDCLKVLQNHGISIEELRKKDTKGTLAVLSMRSSQLEQNIIRLKEAGLQEKDIEKLDAALFLCPLEDSVVERVKHLLHCSIHGDQLPSLMNTASSSKSVMCPVEDARSIAELECLVQDLNLSHSLMDNRALRMIDANKLRLNLMELTGSPLFMMPKLLSALLTKHVSRDILTQSKQKDLREHIHSIMALADDQSMANIVQRKLREQPLLLDPALNITEHAKFLKDLFPQSSKNMALLFRQHAYLFLRSKEEINERISICEDVPDLTVEKMLQINVFKRPLMRLQSAVEVIKTQPCKSALSSLQKYLSGQAMVITN